jgi:hypothetical protein
LKLTRKIAKRRAAIANDVIAQIKGRKYLAERQTYVAFQNTFEIQDAAENAGGDLQAGLKKLSPSKPCTVCGLGSAFISAVRLFDKIQVNDVIDEYSGSFDVDNMRKKLREFFTKNELEVIEACFETAPQFIGGQVWRDENLSASDRKRRDEFVAADRLKEFLKELDDEDRLIVLMRAVASLADQKITLRAVRDQLTIALVTDKTLRRFRDQFGL